jgi:surface carbohydrate biosynthesis protein
MPKPEKLLLIPVENQVRELDPKLLLACIAAGRGFTSVIGSRREMEFNIDDFPRGIYLSKSMTIRSLLFFRVARLLGNVIVAWDEEALVHLPPETYFSRRLDRRAIKFISHLFAWGEDNADLWRQYPHLPAGIPIHETGNPRGDLLRPELRTFYQDEVDTYRKDHGDFILINTNFNHVNAYGPDMNLFRPAASQESKPKFGRAARGMSRAYAEGLRDHKLAVFKTFQEMIPRLEESFREINIVVRPHPTENHDVYKRIAAGKSRIRVTNEGNVVPWLLACNAVIHNGCTTGVEAYVLGVPAISYRQAVNEVYDYGFYRLPNLISHQCHSFDELKTMLNAVIRGDLGSADGDERRALLAHHFGGLQGTSCCEQIVAVLEEISRDLEDKKRVPIHRKFVRWLVTRGLHMAKAVKSHLPGSHNRPEFQRHRYPGIPLEDVRQKVNKFQTLLRDKTPLKVDQLNDVTFQIKEGVS